jgi:two-component system response regulator RpaA
MKPTNILIIEDDEIVAKTIERVLRGDEFKVNIANSGVEGLQQAHRLVPDLVVLDVIMPGMDGYTVCRQMRADPILEDVPILFLTAKTKDEDKIDGFKAGADDYLGKPFNIDELLLRIRAILRRVKRNETKIEAERMVQSSTGQDMPVNQPAHMISIGGFALNTRTYELQSEQLGTIRLTPVQYDLLYHLMSHPGEIFSPNRLLDEVWDYPSDTGSPDLVRVHIKNLRERIENDPREPLFIKTVPGFGYTIQPD